MQGGAVVSYCSTRTGMIDECFLRHLMRDMPSQRMGAWSRLRSLMIPPLLFGSEASRGGGGGVRVDQLEYLLVPRRSLLTRAMAGGADPRGPRAA
jgi:hypothetical protein